MKKTIVVTMCFLLISFLSKAQTQYYYGTSDEDNIKATITWNSDETVKGTYYFTSNPSRVYKLSGTNYVEGEIEITESLNGRRTGSGTLYKTLKKGRIVWSGDILNTDGSESYLYLTRLR
jgi:hypothetical protein